MNENTRLLALKLKIAPQLIGLIIFNHIRAWYFYLQRNEESDCLHRIVASVHIVSHEEVVCVWRLAPDLKELHQVVKLTVDVPTDRHRTSHLLHVGLLCQNLLCL